MKIKKNRTIVFGRATRDLLIASILAGVVGLAACDTGPTAPTSLTGNGTGTQQTATVLPEGASGTSDKTQRSAQSVQAFSRIQELIAELTARLAPDGGDDGTPTPGASIPTVTVTASGVSPKEVRVEVGGQVRFVNDDTVNRQINSNPFPAHDGCPPINEVSLLTPGQSKMTGVLSLEGSCSYHEHLTEGVAAFGGTILVGNAVAGDDPPVGY